MDNFKIRSAIARDAKSILEIYSHYIENTAATFETQVPSLSDFAKRIDAIAGVYPYLLCEIDGEIVGYAYASRHRERDAYRYDIDVSVYVKNGCQSRGIGTLLYQKLFEALANLNYYNAYASITLPNEGSAALHHKFGFCEIGIHHKTGYKFGKWHDVLWLEKPLKDHSALETTEET